MPTELVTMIVAAATVAVFIFGTLVLFARSYVKVPAGSALVIHAARESRVSFTGSVVLPILQHSELVDCSTKTFVVERTGKSAYRCADRIRVSVTAQFHVRINRTADDVLRVAQTVSAARTFDLEAVRSLFEGKCDEATATVLAQMTYDEIDTRRDHIKDLIIEVIGRDLNGYVLDDMALVKIEQVPVANLDPADIHDAEAIRVITERTAISLERANEARRAMKKQEIEASVSAKVADLTPKLGP